MWQSIGIFVVKLAITAATVTGIAWGISFKVADYVTEKALAGFATSQQNLAGQMQSLQSSLASVQSLTDNRIADSKSHASQQIEALTARLGDTNAQLARLNGSLEKLADNVKQIEVKLAESTSKQAELQKFSTKLAIQSQLQIPDFQSQRVWADLEKDPNYRQLFTIKPEEVKGILATYEGMTPK